MGKLITKLELGKYAKEIFNSLEKCKIETIGDLEKKTGAMPIRYVENHAVIIERRPSTGGVSQTISYVIEGSGIPIEARFNLAHKYLRLTVKGNFKLPDYLPWGRDPFQNIVQEKTIPEPTISKLKEELGRLRSA